MHYSILEYWFNTLWHGNVDNDKNCKKYLPKPIYFHFTKCNIKCWGNQASAKLAGWILLLSFSNLAFCTKSRDIWAKLIMNLLYILLTKTSMEKISSWLLNSTFNAVFTFVNVFFWTPFTTDFHAFVKECFTRYVLFVMTVY